jgi:hypothetical protein
MRAKLIEDVLFEKFTDKSDPIHDMGIGHTKYRAFYPDRRYSGRRILQYQKSINILGKIITRWVNVPKVLTPEEKKEKRNDENSESSHAYKYYISDHADHRVSEENLNDFIKRWPFIKDYLKYVKEAEEKIVKDIEEKKRREADERYEYFD